MVKLKECYEEYQKITTETNKRLYDLAVKNLKIQIILILLTSKEFYYFYENSVIWNRSNITCHRSLHIP